MNGKTKIPKNSGKAPSIQFYYKDWLSDYRLKRASKRAKGVWIDLIAISCDLPTPGVFSDENGALSRQDLVNLLTGTRRENYTGLDELIRLNIIKQDEDGAFYVKRVKRDMELRRIRRECGLKGGNPVLLGNLDKQNANQKPTPSTSTSTSLYSPNSEEFRLASLLLSEIQKRKPDFKKPNLQKWAIHIDRMIRIDKRRPDRIEAVIRWCQQDAPKDESGFGWQNNILSTEKLRKQFDKLELAMDRESPHNVAVPLRVSPDGLTPREKFKAELAGVKA